VRFGPFRYSTKFDAKLAAQVPLTHKFAKESRVPIFRNERTRSTPLDAKLIFWGILDRFVTAQKSLQNWPNSRHYRTSSLNEVASKCFATNGSIQSNGPKTHVLGHFGPFRYSTKFDAKQAEQVPLTHKFAKESRVRIFHNERTRSTPLGAKLMF
jgi:hypothetical protein